MNAAADVVVIGGGIIGLTTAYRLARNGLTVTLLERGCTGREASWAGAGILPPGDSNAAATTVDRFRCRSVELYAELSAELHALTGIDNEYHVCGGQEFLAGDELDRVDDWRSQNILVNSAETEDLQGIIVPEGMQAFTLPGFAQVRNPRHLKALRAACILIGVQIHEGCEVVGLHRSGERISSVETAAGAHIDGDWFVLAAGAWSPMLVGELGIELPVKPVRGQMLLYRTKATFPKSILLVGKRYVVPRRDGHLLVGSTEEDGGDFRTTTTEAGLRELRTFVESVLPVLRDFEPIRAWAGLRPGTPDGLPYLGIVPGCGNLIAAAGHYRSGLQLSPATAELISAWIAGKPAFDPNFMHTFAVNRISGKSHRPTFQS